jgi:hypothetical protein
MEISEAETMADEWQDTLIQIKTVFGVEASSPSLNEILAQPPSVAHVSRDFVFAEEPEDKTHFRPLHVEPLLDQISNLLDRSLADRAAYQQLNVEFFKAKLQIIEFLRLDAIHVKEENAGFYEVEHRSSQGRLNSLQTITAVDPDITQKVSTIEGTYNPDAVARLIALAAASAHNSLLPFYDGTTAAHLRSSYELGLTPTASSRA